MKRLFLALALLLPLPLVAAPAYVEGRHYLELALPQPIETGSKIEVREFFWYGCPHCFSLEPSIEKWLKTMPKNAQFVRTPGVAPRWLAHARAYYAFEMLGASNKTHVAFFRAMHEQNRPLDNENTLTQFAVENGVDKAKFREAFNSFGVRLKLDKARQMNMEMGVSSVPTLAVDGRYITSPTMAGGDPQMLKVVEFLIQKVAQERKTGAKKP
ncbi:MAG: thiol:disulfide interchange protein DsbA/DsbL [Gammaproteobacteria bacterium]|nr:thiol:disulfide interchange protein DsbA/DsbL [Gammaproteobacteria bacterium]